MCFLLHLVMEQHLHVGFYVGHQNPASVRRDQHANKL